jgi:hypothetical protein
MKWDVFNIIQLATSLNEMSNLQVESSIQAESCCIQQQGIPGVLQFAGSRSIVDLLFSAIHCDGRKLTAHVD